MQQKTFTYFSWSFLAFTLATVLGGALVRATGSGAGCGEHWPLCNGSLLPSLQFYQTSIEFTHRLMSGLILVFTLIQVFLARRTFSVGHICRKSSVVVLLIVILEALLGAGLVLFKLVVHDASPQRAFLMSVHLINTLLLLASLTLTALWSYKETTPAFSFKNKPFFLQLSGIFAFMLVSAAGAITALGDTLFLSTGTNVTTPALDAHHFLYALRIYHPILAILASFYIVLTFWKTVGENKLFLWTALALLLQLCLGFLNIFLLAPLWMQLVHLFVADTIWILLVTLTNQTALSQAKDVPKTFQAEHTLSHQ